MSAPPLPTQLTYGRIRWTVIGLDTDTEADLDDLPDVVSINGRAYVTADVDRDAILGQGLVVPTTILTKRTELLIISGRLQDRAGNTDIKLLANDSPGINPTGWSYTIEYELDDGYTFGSFSFTLTTDELVDLTREIPLGSPSPGVVQLIGPPGPVGEGYGGGFVMGPLDPTAPTAVEIVSRWGLRDDGSVYYDREGAAAGEAALLIPDPATGQFTAFRPGGPFSTPFDVQFSDLINDDTSASYGALTTRFLPASTNIGVNGQFLTLDAAGKPTWVTIPVTRAMHDALADRVTTAEGDVDSLQASVSGLSADKASTAYVDDSVSAEALARVNADIDLQGQINANTGDIDGQNDRLTVIESDFITSVEQAAAIGDATALFRRYFGKLASWPAEAVDGDWFYHTTLKCAMMRLDGFWRQITTARYADAAERDAVPTNLLYSGFRCIITSVAIEYLWFSTAWTTDAKPIAWLRHSAVSAPIPGNVWTTVPWTEAVIDTHGGWTSGTNSRWTVPAGQDGIYAVQAHIAANQSNGTPLPDATTLTARVTKNGAVVNGGGTLLASSKADSLGVHTPRTLLQLVAGNYVEIQSLCNVAWQTRVSTSTGDGIGPSFAIERIR